MHNATKRVVDISYELDFDHKKNQVCMAKELREIVKILQC